MVILSHSLFRESQGRKSNQVRTWRQELIGTGHGGELLTSLLSLFSYRVKLPQPKAVAPPTWPGASLSTTKEEPDRVAYCSALGR